MNKDRNSERYVTISCVLGGDSVPETSLHLHMTDGSKQSRRLGEKGRESYSGINKADRSVIRSSLVSGRSSHRPLPPSLHPSILQRPIRSGWTRDAPTALRDANKTKQVRWHSESTQASGKMGTAQQCSGCFPQIWVCFQRFMREVKAQMRFSLMVQLHVANNGNAVPRLPLWRHQLLSKPFQW